MKKKYDLKMHKLRAEIEDMRAQLMKNLEDKKDARIAQLTKEHSKKYTEIKNYYSDITATNLDLIKGLKNDINEHQKKEDTDRKLLQQIERENKVNLLIYYIRTYQSLSSS
jgi:predicted metallo-beta-lactamase superfamily hydrolase